MNPSPFVTVLLVISSVAVSHGLFWATVLIGLNQRLSNRLLAFLLIMISLRVGKSTVVMLMPAYQLLFSRVGVVSISAIGPLLFFCAHSLFDSTYKLKIRDWLHFVPSVVLLIALRIKQIYMDGAYPGFRGAVFIDMGVTLVFLWNNRET